MTARSAPSFDIGLDNGRTVDEIVAVAQATELSGFETIWIAEQHFRRGVFTIAAAVAESTSSVGDRLRCVESVHPSPGIRGDGVGVSHRAMGRPFQARIRGGAPRLISTRHDSRQPGDWPAGCRHGHPLPSRRGTPPTTERGSPPGRRPFRSTSDQWVRSHWPCRPPTTTGRCWA